ncbi:MAG: hypothetical protein JNK20_19520 [Flavipsychrobacter sp.]|nr:hypothetical protein [Flavipsychrobacter sp.]
MKPLLIKFMFFLALVFFSGSLVMSGANAGILCKQKSPVCTKAAQTGEEVLTVELSGGLSLAFL